MRENTQITKLRMRPSRVNLVHEVETNGAIRLKELPFVVGVIADLAGQSTRVKSLNQRTFDEVSKDDFNTKLAEIRPSIAMRVPNKLQGDGTELGIGLEFVKIDDFGPDAIVNQVKPLRELMSVRSQLKELLDRIDLDDDAETLLDTILAQPEVRQKCKAALDRKPTPPAGDDVNR